MPIERKYPILARRIIRGAMLLGVLGYACTGVANTATEPEARDEKWLARHAGFVAEAGRGGIDVVFLGDSITDGWRTVGRVLWDEHFAPLHAANFGIDGDRTQHVLWRIDHGTLDGLAPKVVVMMLGTNNTGEERTGGVRNTTEEAIAGVEAVVARIVQRLPNSRILLLALFPRSTPESAHRAQIKIINTALAKLADGDRIHYLDIGAVLVGADGRISPYIMPDLLHPTEAGYALWAAALKEPLTRLLAQPPISGQDRGETR